LGNGMYPMVPGHELVGVVTAIGKSVTKVQVGDHVGVGCISDSCLECNTCKANDE
jgi:D-arabinose 1-dehydrogenase-like Zn-dependent alcohol dehydrogenase